MEEKTQINPSLSMDESGLVHNKTGNETTINPVLTNEMSDIIPNATVINDSLILQKAISPGTLLCDGYVVEQKLDTTTGEADLYLCHKDSKQFVAKVYRRKIAVKNEIIKKLSEIESANIARVYASGEFDGFPVVIIPYYKNGSLQRRKYTYIELKKHIIPSINEGLHVLHDNEIIHKDLKPSNIMLNDNGIDVSIIDFGISSVRESGNTVVVTQTGMTPEYSAPETFRNIYLSESDYYSFGITVYELFCGTTPYRNMSSDDIEKYVSVQRIPFPDDMPDDLKDFIAALTYYDITNRKNRNNPNRRWGYEEVKNWCAGEKQIIPGAGIGNTIEGTKIRPYTFLGNSYDDKSTLVHALAVNWNEGKKQLFRGLLSSFFKAVDPEVAGFCLDAEEELIKSVDKEDAIFFETLYKIDSNATSFYWRGKEYKGLDALGEDLLHQLWEKNKTVDQFFGDILKYNLLTIYAGSVGSTNKKILGSLRGIESSFLSLGYSYENRIRVYYLMAYMLSGKKILNISNKEFCTIDDIAIHLNNLIRGSYDNFSQFCKLLINEKGVIDPQFESWLISIGKQNEIEKWRKELK